MREQLLKVLRTRLNEDNDEQGFTLIELLIVIVVLGILAAVTVFGLSGSSSQSAKSACKSDARTIELAADAFHANDTQGDWPTLDQLVDPTGIATQPPNVAPYLRTLPNSTHYTITLSQPAPNSGRMPRSP